MPVCQYPLTGCGWLMVVALSIVEASGGQGSMSNPGGYSAKDYPWFRAEDFAARVATVKEGNCLKHFYPTLGDVSFDKLSPLLTSSFNEYMNTKDILSKFVSERLAVAVVLPEGHCTAECRTAQISTLRSLHTSPEMRHTKKVFVQWGSPTRIHAVHLSDCVGISPVDCHLLNEVDKLVIVPPEVKGVQNTILKMLSVEALLVIQSTAQGMPFTFHPYSLLHALHPSARPALDLLRSDTPLSHLKYAVVLNGELGIETLAISEPITIFRHTYQYQRINTTQRWFISEHGYMPVFTDRCKETFMPLFMCGSDRDSYHWWDCSRSHPLVFLNVTAYLRPDPVALYLQEQIGLIACTNLVQHAPSTFLLETFFQSLSSAPEIRLMRGAIMIDGLRHNNSGTRKMLRGFMRNHHKVLNDPLIKGRYTVKVMDTNGHVGHQIGYAMDHFVKTPYLYVVQTDYVHVKHVNFFYAISSFKTNTDIQHIRLNSRVNTRAPADPYIGIVANEMSQRNKTWVPMLKTHWWSSMNHICTFEHYKKLWEWIPVVGDTEVVLRDYVKRRTRLRRVYGTYVYGYYAEGGVVMHIDGAESHGDYSPNLLKTYYTVN